ncbi:MAG: polysaccharide biosynthesis/export protein [Sphingomonadales bacterium]|nr:polysaccharide biosynthesis/export protein [Sphingomonadales bacterium]
MRAYRHEERDSLFKRLWSGAVVVAAAIAISGCAAGRGGSVPYAPAGFVAPDVQAEPVAASSQPIGALDTVNISVFQVESLTGEFKVDANGKIDYPLLGEVQAQGRTTEELRQLLATGLSQKYLQSPNVQVAIKERAEQKVTVDGAVAQPGVYVVKGPTTLIQAVAMARGTTQDANPSRVYVFRTIRGTRVAGAFDLKMIRRAQAEDPVIYGNDIVVVDGDSSRQMIQTLLQTVPVLGLLRPF